MGNGFSGEAAADMSTLYANHTGFNKLKDTRKRLGYLQYLDDLLVADKGLIHANISREARPSRDYTV